MFFLGGLKGNYFFGIEQTIREHLIIIFVTLDHKTSHIEIKIHIFENLEPEGAKKCK